MRSVLRIGKVNVYVDVLDDGLRDDVQTVLHYISVDAESEHEPANEITVQIRAATLSVPDGAQVVDRTADGTRFSRFEDRIYLDVRGGVAYVGSSAPEAVIYLPEADRAAILYCLFLNAVALALLPFGMFTVHAACLADDSGQGVLVVGPSDSGKSTTAAQFVRNGWHGLSDDSVILYQADDGSVHARALRKDFAMDVSTLEHFPVLEDASTAHLTTRKRRVDLDAVYARERPRSCQVTALLFPKLALDGPTELSSLASQEAFLTLIQQASGLGLVDADHARAHLQLLKKTVQQSAHARLHAGRDFLDDDDVFSEVEDGLRAIIRAEK